MKDAFYSSLIAFLSVLLGGIAQSSQGQRSHGWPAMPKMSPVISFGSNRWAWHTRWTAPWLSWIIHLAIWWWDIQESLMYQCSKNKHIWIEFSTACSQQCSLSRLQPFRPHHMQQRLDRSNATWLTEQYERNELCKKNMPLHRKTHRNTLIQARAELGKIYVEAQDLLQAYTEQAGMGFSSAHLSISIYCCECRNQYSLMNIWLDLNDFI